MANNSALINYITSVIRSNGNQEITGDILQGVLLNIVNRLGYQFAGIATPTTVPPSSPDANIWYLASASGTYTNFNGVTLDGNTLVAFLWDGDWSLYTLLISGTGGGGTSEVTAEWVTTQISNALFPYATKSWVTEQGYLTSFTSGDIIAALGYTPLPNTTNYALGDAVGGNAINANRLGGNLPSYYAAASVVSALATRVGTVEGNITTLNGRVTSIEDILADWFEFDAENRKLYLKKDANGNVRHFISYGDIVAGGYAEGGSTDLSISYTPILETGTEIGIITINGVAQTIYAPEGGSADSVEWSGILNKPTTLEGYGITASDSLLSNYVTTSTLSSTLSGYLPLSGGTISGVLNIYRPSGRSQINLVSQTDEPNDLYFGSNTKGHWALTSRNSAENYLFALYANSYDSGVATYVLTANLQTGVVNFPINATIASNQIIHAGNIGSYNAGSAAKLQTARTIWGQSFDGIGNVSGALSGATSISASGNIATTGFYVNIGSQISQYSATRTELALINPNAEPSMLELGSNGVRKWGMEARGSADDYCLSIYSWTAASHFMRIFNSGNVVIGTDAGGDQGLKLYVGGDASFQASVYTQGWFYTYNTYGWCNATYAAGMFADDYTYVKSYGGKSFFTTGFKAGYNYDNDNRAKIDLISQSDNACDVWLGTNSARRWSINVRPSAEGYWLGFYTPTYGQVFKLYQAGGADLIGNFTATGEITAGSDIRYKSIQNDVTLDTRAIANAPIFDFRWIDREDNKLHLGTSAQYWLDYAPNAVTNSNDFYSLNYGVLGVAIGVSNAKKLLSHEERIAQLENENKQLKEKLERYGIE